MLYKVVKIEKSRGMIGVNIIVLFCHKSIGSDGKCLNQTLRNLSERRVSRSFAATQEGLNFFKKMLYRIADRGLQLSGYFHAQGEGGGGRMAKKIMPIKWLTIVCLLKELCRI